MENDEQESGGGKEGKIGIKRTVIKSDARGRDASKQTRVSNPPTRKTPRHLKTRHAQWGRPVGKIGSTAPLLG
ncbi:hypothetical protein CEXT_260441 [Caerostris extrusa]|uniref:Uncharacterized protein n=1 Tax=Caerostris extrusa TaxID=172846 RepID=A0AAV4UFH2_CAEEX|nr:hypothetical protein CEXT_260441 [Caerostris extrusa]